MKSIFSIIFIMCFATVFSQSITPQVINSAGGGGQIGASGIEVYYNIGEPIVATINNGTNVITQGFLQPDIIGKFGLVVSTFSTNVSCADKMDGSIGVIASISGGFNPADYQFYYYWNADTLCSGAIGTCSVITNLAAGNYSVTVVSHYIGGGSIPDDTVRVTNILILGNSEPCIINVFNGITPNGDNANDFFYISNIEQFPDNNVQIFNRWGHKLFEADHYDNVHNVWKGTENNTEHIAPSGTYFYIIDLKNGSKPIKGWLELTTSK